MGIENRDYMQSDGYGGYSKSSGSTRNILTTIIVVNVVALVLQFVTVHDLSFSEFVERTPQELTPEQAKQAYAYIQANNQIKTSTFEDWCVLDINKVLHGQVWRLLTSAFLHSRTSVMHILWNMLLLYMAGRKLYSHLGPKEFLWFYLTACVLSGIVFCIWGLVTQDMNPALGASGAVSAVMMAYALNWPRDRWLFMMIIPVPVILIVVFNAAYDVFPMLRQLTGHPVSDGIAHSAHAGGLLFGYLYYKNQWTVSNWFQWVDNIQLGNLLKRKPKLRVHRPADEPVYQEGKPSIPPDVESRVEELLAKISDQGEASLTHEERNFLAEASRSYRSR